MEQKEALARDERYDRQRLIEGWDQRKLDSARVAIIGSGQLAELTALPLAALGIGSIEIYGDAGNSGPSGLIGPSSDSGSRARSLATALRAMNPFVATAGIAADPIAGRYERILGKPTAIVDTVPDEAHRMMTVQYAQKIGSIAVLLGGDGLAGGLRINQGKGFDESLPVGTPAAALCMALGGMATSELRQAVMPLPTDGPRVGAIAYDAGCPSRFGEITKASSPKAGVFAEKTALLVGAGALGNFIALGLGMEGIGRMIIVDDDTIESTNLNRQVLFAGAVGQQKATTLAGRINALFPSTKAEGIESRLTENSDIVIKAKPDIIIDCVDSLSARAIINYHALRNRIPLVSGGTNPTSGQVVVYAPGRTACLDCRLAVDRSLGQERQAVSCKDAPDPSVVTTNQVISGMMVLEAMHALSGGGEVERILRYDTDYSSRGGVVGPSGPCSCERGDAAEWLAAVDKKQRLA